MFYLGRGVGVEIFLMKGTAGPKTSGRDTYVFQQELRGQ